MTTKYFFGGRKDKMKLVIGLIIVLGILIGLKLIAQGKGLTVTELIHSWLPTMPTGLEKGEEPLTTQEAPNPTLIDFNPTLIEPLIAQIQWK